MDGRSFLQIKRGLEADGILNGAGNARWHESNIKQILTNEKYIGDALLQKTYTVNTLKKKRVANNGIAPKYYVEGSHDDPFLRFLHKRRSVNGLHSSVFHKNEVIWKKGLTTPAARCIIPAYTTHLPVKWVYNGGNKMTRSIVTKLICMMCMTDRSPDRARGCCPCI